MIERIAAEARVDLLGRLQAIIDPQETPCDAAPPADSGGSQQV
jgi:hypothetical protein